MTSDLDAEAAEAATDGAHASNASLSIKCG